MATILNLEDARNRQRSACDTEKFYALLDGWELERSEDGVTPGDILELIAELADVMDFSADYVAGYLKLHRGQEI